MLVFKRPISLILAIAMVFSIMAISVSAEEREISIYIVENDSSKLEKITITDDIFPKSINVPQREGYTFCGFWGYSTDGYKKLYYNEKGEKIEVPEKLPDVLYGSWEAEYTVTLNPNGGEGKEYSVKVTFGSPLPTLDTSKLPKKEGKYFAGYFYSETNATTKYYEYDGRGVGPWNIATDTTLYAQWNDPAFEIVNPSSDAYHFSDDGMTLYIDSDLTCDSIKKLGDYREADIGIANGATLSIISNSDYAIDASNMSLTIMGQNASTSTLVIKSSANAICCGDDSTLANCVLDITTSGVAIPSGSMTINNCYGKIDGAYSQNYSSDLRINNSDSLIIKNISKITLGENILTYANYNEVLPENISLDSLEIETDNLAGFFDFGSGGTKYYDKNGKRLVNSIWQNTSNLDLYIQEVLTESSYISIEGGEAGKDYHFENGGKTLYIDKNMTCTSITCDLSGENVIDVEIYIPEGVSLTIESNGYNCIYCDNHNLKITGGGILNISSEGSNAIYATNGTVSIYDCNCNITGTNAIYANNGIVLDNVSGKINGAISGLKVENEGGSVIIKDSSVSISTIDCTSGTIDITNYTGTLGCQIALDNGQCVNAFYGQDLPQLENIPSGTEFKKFLGYFDSQTDGTKYYNADGTSAKKLDKVNLNLYPQWENLPFFTVEIQKTGGGQINNLDNIDFGSATDIYIKTINGIIASYNGPSVTSSTDGDWKKFVLVSDSNISQDEVTAFSNGLHFSINSDNFEAFVKIVTNDKVYRNYIDVTYDLDGGTLSSGNTGEMLYATSKSLSQFPTPSKSGYTFKGWQIVGKDTTTSFNSLDYPNGLNLKATWQVNAPPPPPVYVDDSGDSGDDSGSSSSAPSAPAAPVVEQPAVPAPAAPAEQPAAPAVELPSTPAFEGLSPEEAQEAQEAAEAATTDVAEFTESVVSELESIEGLDLDLGDIGAALTEAITEITQNPNGTFTVPGLPGTFPSMAAAIAAASEMVMSEALDTAEEAMIDTLDDMVHNCDGQAIVSSVEMSSGNIDVIDLDDASSLASVFNDALASVRLEKERQSFVQNLASQINQMQASGNFAQAVIAEQLGMFNMISANVANATAAELENMRSDWKQSTENMPAVRLENERGSILNSDGIPSSAVFSIEPLEIPETIADAENCCAAFDISLEGVEIGGTYTISLQMPKELAEYHSFSVIHEKGDGTTETLRASIAKDGTLTFKTKSFSNYYVIAKKPVSLLYMMIPLVLYVGTYVLQKADEKKKKEGNK